MAISVGNVFAAAMAACLVVGCVQGMPGGGPHAGVLDGAQPVAAVAEPAPAPAPAVRAAEPSVEQARRTALMYQPQPMRAVAAALRAGQRQMQPGRSAGDRALASPARSTGP
ncbi:hypothetical protein [Luteimonas sp. MC1895]|uniref:hypothetical protein n=1 Tax=Luteimonas sp. MC1895 TaxID=2819513 RepID=UPI0018F0B2E6|nr:hypothetical protein [Luteimonas sp. MC1895]MBJ6979404.1 hypothetical protein [Luteimonas sp. MC1895]